MYSAILPFVIILEIVENSPASGLILTAISGKTLGWDAFIHTTHSLQKIWIRCLVLIDRQDKTSDRSAYLVYCLNVRLLRYEESIYSYIHPSISPPSDSCQSTACDYGLLDFESGKFADKIAFRDLA